MTITDQYQGSVDDIVALFDTTFAASEGPEEGHLIGGLVQNLLTTTAAGDLFVFSAQARNDAQQSLCGGAIFSRLIFPEDPRTAFILSPMAVAPGHQRQGWGQYLLKFALKRLHNHGVKAVFTYGDPAYYSKIGFRQIAVHNAQPPLPLSMPHGWLGQAQGGAELAPFAGRSHCVPALNNPHFW